MTASPTEEFFGFSHRPFRGTPDSQDYVAIDSIEQEIERLLASTRQGDGVSVLTAPPGAGKSVVCERLRHELSHDFKATVLSSSGFATRRALLQAMLFALGQPYESFSEQELRLGVLSFARSVATERNGIALIVDEAHLLNARLLEELRCLTNHSEGGRPLIRVILCGQLPLEDALVDPTLQALNYRITCHSTLEPLSIQESAELIAGRLVHAGRTVGTIFSPAALETICRVSDGNPRCLVQLSDQSLALAAQRCEVPVSVEAVRLALKELKQLPLHWNESTTDRPSIDIATKASEDHGIDTDAGWSVVESEDVPCPERTGKKQETTSGDDLLQGWSSAVSSVEVGSTRNVYDECEVTGEEDARVDATSPEFEDVPLAEIDEAAEFDEIEAVEDEVDSVSDSLLEWNSSESAAPIEDDDLAGEIFIKEPSAVRSPEPAASCHSSSFVELSVEDSYAALDSSTARAGGLRDAAELAAMLNSSVSSKRPARASQTVVHHEPEVDLPVAVESLREASGDAAQRIDEVMAALSLAVDEPTSAMDDEPADRVYDDDDLPEIEWQTAGDSGRFDMVEPYGEPIWDEEEPVIEVAPAPLETAMESPAPAIESHARRPTGGGSLVAHHAAEQSSDKRPYAHLFSRLRRRRA